MNQLKQAAVVQWTDQAKKDLKNPSEGILEYHTEQPFILDTNLSAVNMAAVLSQIQGR